MISADQARAQTVLCALDTVAESLGIDASELDPTDVVAAIGKAVATLLKTVTEQADALAEVWHAAGLDREVISMEAGIAVLCDRVRPRVAALTDHAPRAKVKPAAVPLLVGSITLKSDCRSLTLVERDTGGGIDVAAVAAHAPAVAALMEAMG